MSFVEQFFNFLRLFTVSSNTIKYKFNKINLENYILEMTLFMKLTKSFVKEISEKFGDIRHFWRYLHIWRYWQWEYLSLKS